MAYRDQQNVGNFMTARSSTRINKPPGGSSSLSLCWGEEPSTVNRRRSIPGSQATPRPQATPRGYVRDDDSIVSASMVSHSTLQPQATPRRHATPRPTATPRGYVRDDVSIASASMMSQSSRVRVPPGGRSSVCLSWADEPGHVYSRMSRIDDESGAGRSFAQTPFRHRTQDAVRVADRFHNVGSKANMEPLPIYDGVDAYSADGASYTESAYMQKASYKGAGVDPASLRNALSDFAYDSSYTEPTYMHKASLDASAADVASMRMAASGQPRESSNRFANHAHQNRGNFITDKPTTYVSAPPGGASSICLGSSAADPAFERSSLTLLKKRMSKRSQVSPAEVQPDHSVADSGFAPLEFQSNAGIESSAVGGRYGSCKSASGFANAAQRHGSDISCGQDTNATDRYFRKQPEVEGSRPKVWRPSVMPRAPPGGTETYDADLPLAGKKRFPDGCAGNNPDLQAVEALRFYQQTEQRRGKQRLAMEQHPHAEKQTLDSHRYHLNDAGESHGVIGKGRSSEACHHRSNKLLLSWDGEGGAEAGESHGVIGKGRSSEACQHRSNKLLLAWEADAPAVGRKASKMHLPSSQSTCVDSSDSSMQELRNEFSETWDQHFWSQPPVHEENEEDDLPLGAEWCTFYD